MRKILIIIFIMSNLGNAESIKTQIEKQMEQYFEGSNPIDISDKVAKTFVTIGAVGDATYKTADAIVKSNMKINVGISSVTSNLGKGTVSDAINNINKDFFDTFYKSMYGAKNERQMRSMLNVLTENDEGLKEIESMIVNHSLTVRKYKRITDAVDKSAEKFKVLKSIPKGLSVLGAASSVYGLLDDAFNDDRGLLKFTKGANNLYGVVDATIGVYKAFGLAIPRSVILETGFTSKIVGKANLLFGLVQLEGAFIQYARDNQIDIIYLDKIARFKNLEQHAKEDIGTLIQYVFEDNTKDRTFDVFFDNRVRLNISNDGKEGLDRFKNYYNEKLSNQELLEYTVKKIHLSELDQHDKAYIMFLSINEYYQYKANEIIKEFGEIIKDGYSFSSTILTYQTLGGGTEIFRKAIDVQKILQTFIEPLERSRKMAYSNIFTQYFLANLYKAGQRVVEGKRQLAQEDYDSKYILNNSYKYKVHGYGMSTDMVSFSYDSSNRIDKCVSRSSFYNGLNYVFTKDFDEYKGEYLDNQEFYNFAYGTDENSDNWKKQITIKEALYFIDLYTRILLKEINLDNKYLANKISPLGKEMRRKMNKLRLKQQLVGELKSYVRRQYVQMQGKVIAKDKNELNSLDENKCLTGYKALDLLDNYVNTLYYYNFH